MQNILEESRYNFDSIPDRSGTNSLKWLAVERDGAIPMWVADMDFLSAPCIIQAMRERIEHGIFGYTRAARELSTVLVERFATQYASKIDAHWLQWLPGVVPALSATCIAFSEAGDEVLTLAPIYPPFLSIAERLGRKTVRVPLKEESGRWRPDVDAFAEALSKRSRIFFLCQPHNPTGVVYTPDELAPILAVCAERDILVVSDEIHCDLILDGQPHRPILSWACAAKNRLITLMSPGKTFNTAGLNMAFAVVSEPEIRSRYRTVCEHLLPQPNALALTAALSAYRDGEPWRCELIKVLQGHADSVARMVKAHSNKLRMNPVQATYLAWIDASGCNFDDAAARFREGGVLLSDGRSFGDPAHVRLNFGCPPELLKSGLQRIEALL